MIYLKWPKWIGLLLLATALQVSAASNEEDAGPMPQPKGPFFSSKPLLYYGEEPELATPEPIVNYQNSEHSNSMIPAPRWGYPQNGYPYSYAPNMRAVPFASSPFGYGGNRMPFQQMPAYPQIWQGQQPIYPGYPPFPQRERR
ncbi:MAG: hypothetical protein OQK25_03710 [Gammaproteobacteria bacterium]|nr:hypothetical protein [Gammaproteobacteria bacterium]